MCNAVFLILVLVLSFGANANAQATNPCPDFKLPHDLTNCGLLSQAKIQYTFLRSEVQRKFAQNQVVDGESMDRLIEIIRYLSPCESKDCKTYDFNMTQSQPHGWTKVKNALITTTDNRCAYNKKYLLADSHSTLDSPTSALVVMIKKMPKKAHAEEPFYNFPNTRIVCPAGENRPAIARSFIFSYKGIYVSDAPDGDPSQRLKSGTTRINIRGGGRPEMIFQNSTTLRFRWPNGAYVDVADNGDFKNSNFLDSKSFVSNTCQGRVSANGRVASSPKIFFKPGQSFAGR